MLLTIVSLIVDAGVSPPGSSSYAYLVAAQSGLASSLCTCLMINGFVGFQLYEDGTTLSVWLLRLCSLVMFIISGAVSLLTFKGWGGLNPENPVGVFVILYVVNAIQLFVYVASQIILVVGTLEDRWPLGDILFGVFFFVVGQVILYVVSDKICQGVQHYLDGLFFATICNLLGVMMVYKVSLTLRRSQRSNCLPTLSTGIRSLAKISSSPWASSNTIGKSRSFCPKTTNTRPCTPRPSIPHRYTTSLTTARHTIRLLDTSIYNSLLHSRAYHFSCK
jgi:hypothetical protein